MVFPIIDYETDFFLFSTGVLGAHITTHQGTDRQASLGLEIRQTLEESCGGD